MSETEMSKAASDVFSERQGQIDREGWTLEHDDQHCPGNLALAATAYAACAAASQVDLYNGLTEAQVVQVAKDNIPPFWPWDAEWWKPEDPRRTLVKAGALIIAEIERIDRAAIAKAEGQS